ncbi:MAG: peptidoglycan bridge formation glycyltransferase FemA/FemB family protein [Propionibacteriales bacterium]|nr:peptidoglycan bridge formation glycyltransferase FemA/FemB family protein [Propionibacteriales bacterium]
MTVIDVRAITASDHLRFLQAQPQASFLQTPAWGEVKDEWRRESIGWFRGGDLVGVGLVLYRQLPGVKKYLAYLPEGPVIDWAATDLASWLTAMVTHLKTQGAFSVRMGPPVVTRSWSAGTVKKAIADDVHRRLADVPPDSRNDGGAGVQTVLRNEGWRPQLAHAGFSAGQPQYVFQLSLAGRNEDDVLTGMNQQWRRNIKRAHKAGVLVTQGGREDLAAFHTLYAETARRDHFTPRPLSYFQKMMERLQAEEADRIRLYLAHHEGDLVAAATWVRVGGHTWYSYGASSTAKRDVRGSNAIQWQMIRDSIAIGATVYDLRGVTDTLDSNDPHIGLIQFKVGTGGEVVEYVGEWDFPINRLLYKVVGIYMRRR